MNRQEIIDRVYVRMAAGGLTAAVTYQGGEFPAFLNVGDEDNGTALIEGPTIRYRVTDAPELTSGDLLTVDGKAYRVDDPGRGNYERTARLSVLEPQYEKI